MQRKLKGLLVCMLVIVTVIPSLGAMTNPTPWSMSEHIYSRSNPTAPDTSKGSLISIEIKAKVLEVDDEFNFLEGNIKVDDVITGKYTYNSGTPDSKPEDPNEGEYFMTDTTCGVEFKAGGLVFKTDSNDPITLVRVFNDANNSHGLFDEIYIAGLVDFPLSKPGWDYFVILTFHDTTATALSSIELPTKAPVLRDWGITKLEIVGYDPISWELFWVTSWITFAKKSEINLQGFTTTHRTPLTLIQNTVPRPLLHFYLILCEWFPNAIPALQRFISK